jgi:methionine synthase II (cobalamin-independent)
MLSNLPPCATTGVGSLPFADVEEAVEHVAASYDIPFCPQLPLLEGDMVAEWLGADPCCCGWSPERDRERPQAWDAFLRSVSAHPPSHGMVKLQITGPWTLATALGDASLAREIAAWLAASAAAQVRALGEHGLRALLMIDEPALEAAAPNPADAAATWDPLRAVAPAWGLHVCCRVPWDVVEHAKPDVLSFDLAATGAIDHHAGRTLERAFRRGGHVAWGVARVQSGDGTGTAARWLWEALTELTARGLDRQLLLERSMLTPSCGTALASAERERALAGSLVAVAGAGRAFAARAAPVGA